MSKRNLQSLFCGILFCISITALIIACLSFTKGSKGGEYFEEQVEGSPCTVNVINPANGIWTTYKCSDYIGCQRCFPPMWYNMSLDGEGGNGPPNGSAFPFNVAGAPPYCNCSAGSGHKGGSCNSQGGGGSNSGCLTGMHCCAGGPAAAPNYTEGTCSECPAKFLFSDLCVSSLSDTCNQKGTNSDWGGQFAAHVSDDSL